MPKRKGDTIFNVEKRRAQIRTLLADGVQAHEILPFIKEHFQVSERTIQNDIKSIRQQMKEYGLSTLKEGVSKLQEQLENVQRTNRDNPEVVLKSIERQIRLLALAVSQNLYTKPPETLDDVYGPWAQLMGTQGRKLEVSVR